MAQLAGFIDGWQLLALKEQEQHCLVTETTVDVATGVKQALGAE